MSPFAYQPPDPAKALQTVHKFLRDQDFWPEHLEIGETYQVQIEDRENGFGGFLKEPRVITIVVETGEQLTISTTNKIPNRNRRYEYIDQLYSKTITSKSQPLVFRAALCLALAFRLDSVAFEQPKRQKELLLTSDPRLDKFYVLLRHLPWLPTLKTNVDYELTGEPEGPNSTFGAFHTPSNDSYLVLGLSNSRVFTPSGGGGQLIYTYSTLRIIAEAIRLEQEGA